VPNASPLVRPSSTLDRLDLDDVVVEQGRNATGPVAVEEVLRDEDDSLEDGVLTEGDLARPRIGLAEPLGADEETTLRWHHPRAAQLTLEPAATHHLAGERAELDARTTVSRGRRSRREPGGRPALREHQHLLGARPGSRPPTGRPRSRPPRPVSCSNCVRLLALARFGVVEAIARPGFRTAVGSSTRPSSHQIARNRHRDPAIGLRSNPGPSLLWRCRSYSPARIPPGLRPGAREGTLEGRRSFAIEPGFSSWPFLALAL